MFDFITISSNVHRFSLNNVNLEQVSSIGRMFEINKFDFFVRFVYNSTANNNDRLSCSLGYSDVLFEERTVEQITRRFQHLFQQIFSSQSNVIFMDESVSSINHFSLILPEEIKELDEVVFHRLENITNEGM